MSFLSKYQPQTSKNSTSGADSSGFLSQYQGSNFDSYMKSKSSSDSRKKLEQDLADSKKAQEEAKKKSDILAMPWWKKIFQPTVYSETAKALPDVFSNFIKNPKQSELGQAYIGLGKSVAKDVIPYNNLIDLLAKKSPKIAEQYAPLKDALQPKGKLQEQGYKVGNVAKEAALYSAGGVVGEAALAPLKAAKYLPTIGKYAPDAGRIIGTVLAGQASPSAEGTTKEDRAKRALLDTGVGVAEVAIPAAFRKLKGAGKEAASAVDAVAQEAKGTKLYHGSNGTVTEEVKNYKNVKTFANDQHDVIKTLAEQGNKDAQALVKNPKDFYVKADKIIQKEYGKSFEAVRYENKHLPQKGVEYQDMKTSKFYAENPDTASVYARQSRGAKYVENVPRETSAPKAVQKEYPTIHQGGKVKMVKGEPVKIVDGIDTFLHKGDGGWIVSESTTGRFIAESRSKEGVIAKAAFNINNVGKEKVASLIAENKLPSESIAVKAKTPKVTAEETKLLNEAKKYSSPEEFIQRYNGGGTQYDKYNPSMRYGGTPGSKRLSELGIDPEKEVTIYRGIDDTTGKVPKKINDGDFVTTDLESARSYASSDQHVVSMKVKAKNLFADDPASFKEDPFYVGSEYVYSSKSAKTAKLSDAQLTDIYKRAHAIDSAVPKQDVSAEDIKSQLKQAEDSYKQGGYAKLPTPGVSAKKIEGLGVSIENKQAKRPLTNLLGLQPMRELGKLDPAADNILRSGRNAFQQYESASTKGAEILQKAWKGITEPERAKLVDLQESGQLTPEKIAQLPEKYQRAINNGFRWFNKEMRSIAQNEFKIDTSKWSYNEDNYFHHMFLGDQMLKIDGKTQAIGKTPEMLMKAKELIDSGVPPKSISIGPKFMQNNAPTTLLSEKGFWAFVNKTAKNLEISSNEVLDELQGVAGIKPRKKFVGAFKQRVANLEGYNKDPELVYKILWDRIQRKRFLEKFTRDASAELSNIKTPWLKKEMEDYIQTVGGKYVDPLYFGGINVSKLAHTINRGESLLKLGYRPSTALVNRMQPLQTSYAELGHFYFKGEGMRLTSEGKSILEKLDVGSQRTKISTGEMFGAEKMSGRGTQFYKPLGLFSKAEKANREAVSLGAYLKGIDKGLSEKDAVQYAHDVVSATQFVYDVTDLPKVFRHPIGKMTMQFKQFAINNIYNTKNIILGKPLGGLEKWDAVMGVTKSEQVARAARWFTTNLVIGGLKTALGLPFGVAALTALGVKNPLVFKGVFNQLGVDLSDRSSSSPLDLVPKTGWDLLGPFASDVQKFYKAIKSKDYAKLLAVNPTAWDFYKGLVGDSGAVNLTPTERGLLTIGFKPSRVSKIQDINSGILNRYGAGMITETNLPTEKNIESLKKGLASGKYDDKPERKAMAEALLKELEKNKGGN